ncbi:unnamed protein product [Dicrocoelium dendriticum]|nr:unnamed protein product [Dicrocoelium dendriticum]
MSNRVNNLEVIRGSDKSPFQRKNISRAPSPNVLSSSTQRGTALATEIDAYRRRIQTLLHFLDCIAQHWWDHLYPYKRSFIKRPSKSADEVRSYRTRLLARLSKCTTRTVAPAAAAIATMEAHASIKLLPPNLLSPIAPDVTHTDVSSVLDNSDVLLQKAFSLARRLGDIEKLKQRLILSVLTWITSDGRDFNLRAQRVALLARHVEPCLIEHFAGVRALLTHYYRPRVLVQKHVDKQGSTVPVSSRVEPITAARLTTTNEQIAEAIESVSPRAHRYLPIAPLIGPDDAMDDLQLLPIIRAQTDLFQYDPADQNALLYQLTTDQGTVANLVGSRLPILPSIVLNPLSIDTSQLDWLSYEINQRNFNLHILNSEEPEEVAYRDVSSASPSPPPSDSKLVPGVQQKEVSLASKVSRVGLMLPRAQHRKLSPTTMMGTPIATPNAKVSNWSDISKDSEFSELDNSIPSPKYPSHPGWKTSDERASTTVTLTMYRQDTTNVTEVVATPLPPKEPEIAEQEEASPSWKSHLSSDSLPEIEPGAVLTLQSPSGKGEEPNQQVLDIPPKIQSTNSIPLESNREFVHKHKPLQKPNFDAKKMTERLFKVSATVDGAVVKQLPTNKKTRLSNHKGSVGFM